MQCEDCGNALAKLHLTEIVNSTVTELHLCRRCAERRGFQQGLHAGPLALTTLVAQLMEDTTPTDDDALSHMQCPGCGMFFSTFRETGNLGCAQCYGAFATALTPLLRRLHGEPRHIGKAPKKDEPRLALRRQVLRLHEELERAVGREDYEHAAELRDQIRALESGQDARVGRAHGA